ncbi:MAG: divergent PAP2 family protein [Propionibacteriaceae bacterium]|nr:divergent PAP2 family protein [Propionibacteriaceae bacterium]
MIWEQISLSRASIEALLEKLEWDNVQNAFTPCLLAAIVSFLATVIMKIVILAISTHRLRWSEIVAMVKSGGMPSSHSATVVGLASAIGVSQGFGSAVFALSFIFAVVVMTDATQVRRAVGEQGESLRALIAREIQPVEGADDKQPDGVMKPYHARGHTPLQVLIGALVGLVCGLLIAGLTA